MKKSLQYPISSGEHLGVKDATSIANTVWNNLAPSDFQSSTTNTNVPSGVAFSDLTVYNSSVNICYLKLRAKTTDGDPTTTEIPVLSGGVFSMNVQGFKSGNVETIAFKKGAVGDKVIFIASFNHVEI